MAHTGRPSKLSAEVIKKLPELIGLGLSDVKIAEVLKVSQPTISTWKVRNQEFSIAYELEKAKVDHAVEKSILKRALGYDKTLRKGDKEHEQHYPGDVQAQIFWLKNRRSESWKDTQIVENNQQPVEIVFNFPRPAIDVTNNPTGNAGDKLILGARK